MTTSRSDLNTKLGEQVCITLQELDRPFAPPPGAANDPSNQPWRLVRVLEAEGWKEVYAIWERRNTLGYGARVADDN